MPFIVPENFASDSQAALQLIVETSPTGLLAVAPKGRVRCANADAATTFGYAKDELEGVSADQLLPGVDLTNDSRGGSEGARIGRRKDGVEFSALVSVRTITLGDEPVALVSVFDVSEQSGSLTWLRAAAEAVPSGILISDSKWKLVYVNQYVAEVFGYMPGELVGRGVEQLVPDVSRDAHAKLRDKYLDDPKKRAMGAGRHLHGRHKDGSLVPVEVGLTPYSLGGELLVLASVVDIQARIDAETERKNLERRVQHAQRLEALGVFSGGIAHDFNNLLLAVLGHTELALTQVYAGTPLANRLERVREGILTSSRLTKQLLDYAGESPIEARAPIEASAVTREVVDLMRASISRRAVLHLHLADGLPLIIADAGQWKQVVMNLVMNASDALDDDPGDIHVRTGIEDISEGREAETFLFPDNREHHGPHLYLEVSDNGKGMSPEVLERIFDPFYTTKSQGRGLGLAAVYGILRAHRAGVRIESKPRRGTTIRIVFPTMEPDEESQTPTDIDPEKPRILIVEDEARLRSLFHEMIKVIGYRSDTAADGVEGLEKFRSASEPFDLILLDMTMPRMDGRHMLAELRKTNPDTPVILTSGYNETVAVGDLEIDDNLQFLAKPFDQSRLRALLTQLLHRRSKGDARESKGESA